jgi:hypothetical protein
MVNMQELKLNKKDDNILKVYVNEYDDFILLDAGDAMFMDRFVQFLQFVEDNNEALKVKEKEYNEKYHEKPLVTENEDGDAEVDVEQLLTLTGIKTAIYKEYCEKIDTLFGQGTIKKYFRLSYEINPDFVPDEDCIADFIEQITPAIEKAYSIRADKISKKYSKNRRGKKSDAK